MVDLDMRRAMGEATVAPTRRQEEEVGDVQRLVERAAEQRDGLGLVAGDALAVEPPRLGTDGDDRRGAGDPREREQERAAHEKRCPVRMYLAVASAQ